MFTSETRNSLHGKSAIITGGSRGIGFSTAQAFLNSGARVAICGLDRERLSEAHAQFGSTGRVLAQVADVANPAQVESFFAAATRAFGPIHVLVNNAGVLYAGPFAVEPVESIGRLIDVNLKGVMYMTRAVLPSMIARGDGVIVNVSSGAGLSGFPEIVSYCASKFGVIGFSEALDQEVRKLGVRIHALCPGRVATDMQSQYSGAKVGMPPAKVARRILELVGAGRGAVPEQCVLTV